MPQKIKFKIRRPDDPSVYPDIDPNLMPAPNDNIKNLLTNFKNTSRAKAIADMIEDIAPPSQGGRVNRVKLPPICGKRKIRLKTHARGKEPLCTEPTVFARYINNVDPKKSLEALDHFVEKVVADKTKFERYEKDARQGYKKKGFKTRSVRSMPQMFRNYLIANYRRVGNPKVFNATPREREQMYNYVKEVSADPQTEIDKLTKTIRKSNKENYMDPTDPSVSFTPKRARY